MAMKLIEHRGTLLGYLLSCVRDAADAEDLFQDVSMAAIRSAAKLRDESGFLPWAREIARRRVLEFYRTSKRLIPVDPELAGRLAETAAELDVSEDASERVQALRSCLESLPMESRRLIAMRYTDKKEPVENLAKTVGRSVQATYAILKRSRILLHDCINKKMNQGAEA